MNQMRNPWLQLRRTPPYCLPADAILLDRFNTRAAPKFRVDTRLLPDPYIGCLTAPVMLLALNPGLGPEDLDTHSQPHFRERCLNNLFQRPQEYPFYYLDPANLKIIFNFITD